LSRCPGSSGYLEKQQRPNILLVMVDDMGWSDTGCFGSEEVQQTCN
jgi:arylsulfatase A-like enzyme